LKKKLKNRNLSAITDLEFTGLSEEEIPSILFLGKKSRKVDVRQKFT